MEQEITIIIFGLIYVIEPIIMGIASKEYKFKHPIILAICCYFINGIALMLVMIIAIGLFRFDIEKESWMFIAFWFALPICASYGITNLVVKYMTD